MGIGGGKAPFIIALSPMKGGGIIPLGIPFGIPPIPGGGNGIPFPGIGGGGKAPFIIALSPMKGGGGLIPLLDENNCKINEKK